MPVAFNFSYVPCHRRQISNHLIPTPQRYRTQLGSSSLARLPLTCSLRRSLRLTLLRYSRALSLLALLLSTLLYTRTLIRRRLASRARVPDLVATSLDRLATQAALHARHQAPEAWLSVGQLRDDVLREIFDIKERENLWLRVKGVVERNANVRASVREGRGGDVSRVWEWIGGLAGIEGPASGERKRVSFYQSPEDGDKDGKDGGNESPALRVRKWDEGRPIY